METRKSEWEEEKYFSEEQVSTISLKDYKNLLTSWRWSTKDPKDAQILDLVEVAKNLADYSKKSSDKSNTSNRASTNGEPA